MRNGGIVPPDVPTQLADRGAVIRHGEAALNLSGHAERVLDPAQTRTYEAAVTQRMSPAPVVAPTIDLTPVTSLLRLLRGDVDQSGLLGEIAQEVRGLRGDTRGRRVPAVATAQSARIVADLGAW